MRSLDLHSPLIQDSFCLYDCLVVLVEWIYILKLLNLLYLSIIILNLYTFLLACRLRMSVEDENHVAKFNDPFLLIAAGIISILIDFPGTPFNKAKKGSNFIRKELINILKQRRIDLEEGVMVTSPTQDILSNNFYAYLQG